MATMLAFYKKQVSEALTKDTFELRPPEPGSKIKLCRIKKVHNNRRSGCSKRQSGGAANEDSRPQLSGRSANTR
jgi:hypothetical protein